MFIMIIAFLKPARLYADDYYAILPPLEYTICAGGTFLCRDENGHANSSWIMTASLHIRQRLIARAASFYAASPPPTEQCRSRKRFSTPEAPIITGEPSPGAPGRRAAITYKMHDWPHFNGASSCRLHIFRADFYLATTPIKIAASRHQPVC